MIWPDFGPNRSEVMNGVIVHACGITDVKKVKKGAILCY